jgi:hypothetical protein
MQGLPLGLSAASIHPAPLPMVDLGKYKTLQETFTGENIREISEKITDAKTRIGALLQRFSGRRETGAQPQCSALPPPAVKPLAVRPPEAQPSAARFAQPPAVKPSVKPSTAPRSAARLERLAVKPPTAPRSAAPRPAVRFAQPPAVQPPAAPSIDDLHDRIDRIFDALSKLFDNLAELASNSGGDLINYNPHATPDYLKEINDAMKQIESM